MMMTWRARSWAGASKDGQEHLWPLSTRAHIIAWHARAGGGAPVAPPPGATHRSCTRVRDGGWEGCGEAMRPRLEGMPLSERVSERVSESSVGVGWVNAQSPLRAFLLPIFSQHVGGCRENFSRSSLESIGCALRACVGPILAAAHAVVGRLSCLVAPHAHAHTHSAQGSKRRREVMRWVCTQKEQRMLE